MATRTTSWLASGFLFIVCACSRKSAPPPDAITGAPHCFSVAATQNSPKTQATFAAKQCQGGGVTWAALLSVLARRRGKSVAIEAPTPGFTGDVRTLTWDGRVTRFAIDEEGDAALFCADSQRLVDAIQSDVKLLNAQTSELQRAMAEADPLALECFPDDASIAAMLSALSAPPPLSPAEARARDASTARMRAALAKHRTWCWRKSGAQFGGAGGLTLNEDGGVIGFGTPDSPRFGTWTYEDDGRIEVDLSDLNHFDVDEKGHFGFDYAGGREDLDACEPSGSH